MAAAVISPAANAIPLALSNETLLSLIMFAVAYPAPKPAEPSAIAREAPEITGMWGHVMPLTAPTMPNLAKTLSASNGSVKFTGFPEV